MRIPPAPSSSGSTMTAARSRAARGDQSLERADDVACDRIGQARDVEQLRGERIGEQPAIAHAHRAERVAMVRVLERGDQPSILAAILPVLKRDLHGDFDGRRPVVGEEDALQAGRRARDSSAASRAPGSCVKPAKITCSSVRACSAIARGDLGLRVAVQRHPPGRDRVEDSPPGVVDEIRAARRSRSRSARREGRAACTDARRSARRQR